MEENNALQSMLETFEVNKAESILRHVSKKGITLKGKLYFAEELKDLVGMKVIVYQASDISILVVHSGFFAICLADWVDAPKH